MIKSKIITLCIILLTFSLYSQSDLYFDYVLTRASSNFNGVDFNDKVIVVYGDAGVLVLSFDRGNNWEQINLNDSLNIVDMTNIDDNFYGIAVSKYLIWSKDNARSWTMIDLGKDLKFHRIFIYNDKLYIISNNKIIVYGRNLTKIKEYNYTIDVNYYDACLVGNKIIYVSGYGKLSFINLDNEETGVIDLTDYDLCSRCPIPYNLTSNQQDLIFFTLGYELFRFDLSINNIQYLCQPPKIKGAPFATDGSDIYQIYSKTDTIYEIDSLFFGIADKSTNDFKDIKMPGNDRYIDNLLIKDLKFISKDTIIAVGGDKLIYMSFNGGKNWVLKSLMSGINNFFSYVFLKDNQNARIIAAKGKFISTKNAAATWLPQKNYHSVFIKNLSFAIKYKSIPYFKDLDHGFIYGESLLQKIDTNVLFTKDGGETVEMKKIKNLQHFDDETEPLLTVYKGNPIIITQRTLPNSPHYTVFDVLNSNADIISRKYIKDTMIYCIFNINDKFYAVGRDFKQELPYTYKLYHAYDTSFNWIEDMSFKIDTATWESSFSSASNIDDIIFISFSYIKVVNKKDILQFCKIYSIDTRKKIIKEVYKDDSTFFQKALKLNNKYFAFLQKDSSLITLYSDNTSIPIRDWKKLMFKRITPPKLLVTESRLYGLNGFLSDTLFYFIAYDSLYNREYLFKARSKKTLNVEETHQIEVIPNVCINSIHPNPAYDFLKISINWNQKYDIDKADFRVFNILGEIVANKDKFSLLRVNDYSGELTLNTTDLPNGVYLVSAILEGSTLSQVFVVLK